MPLRTKRSTRKRVVQRQQTRFHLVFWLITPSVRNSTGDQRV